MDKAAWFTSDYSTAGSLFRAAAAARGLEVEAFANPARGPRGEALETLVTAFGPADAGNVLVLNSGTHGTEAFVGAGVLVGLLREPAGLLDAAPDTRVVMIHMINPYGAAWGRYVNEDNVDLMKNLTYGDVPTPPDPLFQAFDDAYNLAGLNDPEAEAASRAARRALVGECGMDRLMASLKKGQSDRPKSICYNGRGATWSRRTLETILARRLAGARNVLFVDLHSGVGDYGEAHLLVGGDDASCARVRALLGEDAHESDLVMSVPVYSTLAAFAPGARFTAVTMEAGTVTFGEDFNTAMRLEMHHHLYGDPLSEAAEANRRIFRGFYDPQTAEWRNLWSANARAMLARLLSGLEAWGRADASIRA